MSKQTKKRPNEDEKTEKSHKKSKHAQHWSLGLLSAMDDPELKIKSDELVVVIRDKYPKAEFHYLVLPKEDISSLKSLKQDHVKLLKHMEKVAKELIEEEQHENHEFKIGYHAEASMARLHLHVISQDFNSSCLKTKKHWNTFTTGFFLDAKDVRKSLKENGKVLLPAKEKLQEFMNTPLKCHKCDYVPKHIPDLKHHVKEHIEK